MKTALVSGVTGQDGSFLSELLLSKGYEVHGIKRRSSSFNTSRIDHLMHCAKFHLHYGDVCDGARMQYLIGEIEPDEIYNLAAQSHVAVSFEQPFYTADATALGALRILDAMRATGSKARLYQASSSEMFGNSPAPQSEATPFDPRSPYAVSKVMAHHICKVYRESYGMWVACGILFNHESPRRSETFVTRKIARAAAAIKMGKKQLLHLGNIEAIRDWGYAPEYVEAMVKMLQTDSAHGQDLVIGTGMSMSVRTFAEVCFSFLALNWEHHVMYGDAKYMRPNEVNELTADPRRAARVLNWRPKVYGARLAQMMVEEEMKALGGTV